MSVDLEERNKLGDFLNKKPREVMREYFNYFINMYPLAIGTAVFLMLCSYFFGILSILHQDGISIYDFVVDNNRVILISFVFYSFLMIFIIAFIINISYKMRDSFLESLERKYPDLYQMIRSAGYRGIRGSSKISKNGIFIREHFKSSWFSLLQIPIFLLYIFDYLDMNEFLRVLFLFTLIFVPLSYYFKMYMSVINYIMLPIFFIGFYGYMNVNFPSDTLTMIIVLFGSCILTYVYSTSQIINAMDDDRDNSYGFNILLISVSIFPIWRVFVGLVLHAMGVLHIQNVEIAKKDNKEVIYRGYMVMETPYKIICSESEKLGSHHSFDKDLYYIMTRRALEKKNKEA